MVALASTFATRALSLPSPPITAPVPVSAVWNVPGGYVDLQFDQDIIAGAFNASEYTIFQNSISRISTSHALSASDTVRVQTVSGPPAPPGDVMSYTTPPGAITGTNLIPVVAFVNFPLT